MTMAQGDLEGRVAIVTGAAQGIGAAYARRLAADGAKVVVSDVLDPAPLVDEITGNGGAALGVKADVTSREETEALAAQTTDAFGRIDALVNNAALFGHLKQSKFEDIDPDEWDAVMRVNIKGVWQMTKAVLPAMRAAGYGKIVNIASGTVFKGTPWMLHYVSSKGAVVAMSRAMARELGDDNICVNVLAPGLTVSENVAASGVFEGGHMDRNIAGRAFKRAEMPEDLVGAVSFLCGAGSDFMTGQVMVVDGGSVVH
jgi:NAD(P)-dependent dehydrogenase (short-subunit alcohol dehydrogenase family)